MSDLEAEFARKGALDRARRNWMDRFIDGIELLAAAFIAIVAADIFVAVLLRYFSTSRSRTAMISASCCLAS
jgi:hypothetical protein